MFCTIENPNHQVEASITPSLQGLVNELQIWWLHAFWPQISLMRFMFACVMLRNFCSGTYELTNLLGLYARQGAA